MDFMWTGSSSLDEYVEDGNDAAGDIDIELTADVRILIEKLRENASEICSMLKEKFPEQEFNRNWLYRDLLQHDDEIRALGIDYGKTKSNGIRKIFISYTADRDSSDSKILCTENAVPADPENDTSADDSLIEVEDAELPSEENTVPAVPVEQTQGEALIAMAEEVMRRSLAKERIIVPAFFADWQAICAEFIAK